MFGSNINKNVHALKLKTIIDNNKSKQKVLKAPTYDGA